MSNLAQSTGTVKEFESFIKENGSESGIEERKKRDLELYSEYQTLVAAKKVKGDIARYLMNKYHIKSAATIYVICKRVEERLKEGGTK